MKILYCGYQDSLVLDFLKQYPAQNLFITDAAFDLDYINFRKPDLLVSYGYRYKIKHDVLNAIPMAINLHISYLPYNRGADPNFWSWVEGTPKGVTIHKMDAGIDTGEILLQKEIQLSVDDTLKGTYNILRQEIEKIFIGNFEKIVKGEIKGKRQKGKGTHHFSKDKDKYISSFPQWLEVPIYDLLEYVNEVDASIAFDEKYINEIS